jgi:hypothetical protein
MGEDLMIRKRRIIKRRGQMFILATMLIAVYVVTMSATILNMSTNQIAANESSIREPYGNIKRELQSFLELLLASYTDNSSTINSSYAESELQTFLTTIEAVDSARSILSDIQLVTNSFFIKANMTPSSNVQVGAVYTSTIKARFHLELSDLSSSFNLIEDFNVSFSGRVEVISNTLVLQQSRGSIEENVDATSLFVMNNSVPIIPSQYSNKTGYYFFEGINIDNIGVMSVTLPNGVRIYS